MNTNFPGYRLRWLATLDAHEFVIDPSGRDTTHTPLPIAPDMCSGWFEVLRLTLGMTMFRGVHHFTPAAAGRLVPLADFDEIHHEPTFCVQTAHGGQFCHHDLTPKAELISGPGRDLFRYVDRLRTRSFLDGSSDSEMVSLVVGESVLKTLLGEDDARKLLTGLGLDVLPTAVVRPVPLRITALLRAALTERFHGPARKLFAQAKALEYLVALLTHVSTEQAVPVLGRKRERILDLHFQLTTLQGKLPTLDELARQIGMSARLLNEEFAKEYGQTIHAFITDRRLDEAYEALRESTTPMKVLANRLGYSHVNHFISAFRRKFGYTPGSLRKRGSAPTG